MRVGRDHVASTVNTLFLAYAGASLPLLLLFSVGQVPALDVANSEVVATEIVRTLVGSIGLVATVPLTTWLAVAVVGGLDTGPPVTPGERPPIRRNEPTVRVETSPVTDETTTRAQISATAPAGSDRPAGSDDPDDPDGEAARWRAWSRLRDGIDD